MVVRGIQFSPALGNVLKNMDFHVQKIEEAVKDGVNLIIFPELSLSGYHLKDIVFDVAITPDSEELKIIRELSRDIDIVVGLPLEESPGIIYNAAMMFSGGRVLHTHRKIQLPNFGVFQEAMIFKAGNSLRTFTLNGFTCGLIICREILFPINAYLYFLQNVDFLIGISNSPHRALGEEGFVSFKLWERMGEVFAIHFHQNYIFVNRCGFEDGLGFGGGSFFARPGMGIVEKAKSFHEDILDCELSLEDVRVARISSNYLRDERPDIILKELKRIIDAGN